MIKQDIITHIKNSTYTVVIPHPDPHADSFPTPNGTGFFISNDGYFITARHVLSVKKNLLVNDSDITLTKPEGHHINQMKIVKNWPEYDLILLKTDFSLHKNKRGLENVNGFEYININFNIIPEGTDIFSFGYPLPNIKLDFDKSGLKRGFHYISPRITSAIISSHDDVIGPIKVDSFPQHYVIDKALNYGNSGGPIVLNETGEVISVCSRFQPVTIPQPSGATVKVPSLYGISTSLKNIENDLKEYIK